MVVAFFSNDGCIADYDIFRLIHLTAANFWSVEKNRKEMNDPTSQKDFGSKDRHTTSTIKCSNIYQQRHHKN